MNVLYFYKASMPESYGGIQIFMDTACKATAKLGVTNTVLALSKHPQKHPIQMEGYTVNQVKEDLFIASTGFSLSAFSKFKQLAQQADIIHYPYPNPFGDFLHFACGIKKPTVVTYHSDIIKQKTLDHIYQPLKHKFLKAVDHIVATSPNYLASSDILQRYASKVSIIPIGIDLETYPKVKSERTSYWRKRLPKPFFLFIGALRYYKGLHHLLEAVEGTDIQLAIAGIDGLEKELKQQARSRNLQNVEFLGLISDEDKVALLNLCYGFVFPSHLRSESFGIALLEAAAFGKPLISCEIGSGTTYINAANETGLVTNPAAPWELRQAMQHLLNNPEIAANMGDAAKKRAQDLFTAKKQGEAYLELYKKLMTADRKK